MTDKSVSHVVPLSEEELRIDKQSVVTGKVTVRTRVELVEEIARAELERDTVEITRVPVGRVVTDMPVVRTEGDLTIVPVVEEVLLIEKQLVLTEEIHLRRQTKTEAVSVPVELKKQRADIERIHVADAHKEREHTDE